MRLRTGWFGRGFYEEIRRRDFVVTFAMVARVPLFARLDAASIADLVGILRARTVPAGTTAVALRVPDPERLRIVQALGLTSYICVPILSPGAVLGAMTFVFAESGRHYSERDLAFAQGTDVNQR